MKFIVLFLMLIIAIVSCNRSNFCLNKRSYLRKVDVTKPFHVKGVYCISNSKDTALRNSKCLIKVNMYDRMRGNRMRSGEIRFYGKDTISLLVAESTKYIEITPGRYSIGHGI